MPPGFTKTDRKTTAEHEATTKYRTPTKSEAGQTIDEELGAQDVIDVDKDWYPPLETEVASQIIQIILDSAQPMEVIPPAEDRPYQMFESSDVLGPDQGSTSPVTPKEDRFLDAPGGFLRAPGDGRPPTRPSGRKITGRAVEEPNWKPG